MREVLFVTGGAGFIGSNYLNAFVSRYPETLFVNLDALTYAGRLTNVTVSKLPNYQFRHVDITDAVALGALFAEFQPTGVIHFAAESNVDKSIENSDAFITTNVLGTNNLLRLARAHGVARFHYISTDEVYGSLAIDDPAFTEATPLTPNNPYSASKAAGDLLVRSYHKTYGLDAVITRCSNNYGPNQDNTKLIPRFIQKLCAGETVPLYGEGLQRRDWLHVSDHVSAVDAVFRRGQAGEVYNVGAAHDISNLEVARILIALTGRDESAITYVPDRLGHDFRYALDSSKIREQLDWQPTIDFKEGLATLVAAYATTTPGSDH